MKQLIFSLILLISFSYQNYGRTPKWVKKRPINNVYYIGIGVVSKSKNPVNYVQTAKNKALADLVSEISIEISSNSIFQQIETNGDLKEDFQSTVKANLQDDIKGYELVDTWEKKDNYWIYYKLSKEKYKRLKKIELDKTKKMSLDYLEEGISLAKKNDYSNALLLYSKSLIALKDHLSEDLSVMSINGKINLASTILLEIQKIYSVIKLEPNSKNIEVDANKIIKTPLIVDAYAYTNNQKTPLQRLQLKVFFVTGNGEISKNIQTDFSGKANLQLNRITSKENSQELRVELNIDDILNTKEIEKRLIDLFFNPGQQPSCAFYIKVEGLSAFYQMKENFDNMKAQNGILKNLVKAQLSEQFFTFTNNIEKAVLTIKAESTTTKGELIDRGNYKLYSVFTNLNITIINNKTEEEVFNYEILNIEGRQSRGFAAARQDSYNKLIKQIEKEIIPQLRKIDIKN